jgi:hypothetical protein
LGGARTVAIKQLALSSLSVDNETLGCLLDRFDSGEINLTWAIMQNPKITLCNGNLTREP